MSNIEILAGPRAMAHIREHGLRPQDINIVPGAAGGPKGLGLAKLDEWLFADFLPQGFLARGPNNPIQLIGASIGAWRFAAVCRGHAPNGVREALGQLAHAYCHEQYARNVKPKEVSQAMRDLLDQLFAGREHDVLTNPNYQLNVLVVRGKGILAREQRGRTHAGYALAAAANAAGRKHLRHFLDRTWFRAEGDFENETPLSTGILKHKWLERHANNSVSKLTPLFDALEHDPFQTDYAALTERNFRDVLIASGAIPLVLESVNHIEGAPKGTYWDGGLIDYHLDLPYNKTDGLVLYPHFTNKIVPGWLDKMLPWRKAQGASLDNVVLVCPSAEYLSKLPRQKLPDRSDFKTYIDDFEGRLKYWQFAIDESARLRDELAGLIESGAIVGRLRMI